MLYQQIYIMDFEGLCALEGQCWNQPFIFSWNQLTDFCVLEGFARWNLWKSCKCFLVLVCRCLSHGLPGNLLRNSFRWLTDIIKCIDIINLLMLVVINNCLFNNYYSPNINTNRAVVSISFLTIQSLIAKT